MGIERTAGQGLYARVEREQRWVLRRLPAGLGRPVSITDLYVSGTRLRLRRAQVGSEVVYKFGQKVRLATASPAVVKLTNMYLSPEEYAVLRGLPGRRFP